MDREELPDWPKCRRGAYIYILALGRDGLYKVGKTVEIQRRIKDLSAANPSANLVGYGWVPNPRAVEANIHWLFGEQRATREVFRFGRRDLREIGRMIERAGGLAGGEIGEEDQ